MRSHLVSFHKQLSSAPRRLVYANTRLAYYTWQQQIKTENERHRHQTENERHRHHPFQTHDPMADVAWTLRQSVGLLLYSSVIPATPGLRQEDYGFKTSITNTARL